MKCFWSRAGRRLARSYLQEYLPGQTGLCILYAPPEMSLISTASSVRTLYANPRLDPRKRDQVTSWMISSMDISLNLLLHVDARHLKGLALTAFQACSLSDNRPASIRIPTWLMFHFAVSTKSVMALSACFISWGVYRFVVEDKYLSLAPCYLALHSSFSSHDTPDETALETFSTNLFCPFSFVSVIDYLGAGLLSFAQAHPFFLIHRVSICHVITCAGRNTDI